MRVRGTIEYLGTRWSGWQLQKGAATVQGELERALGIALRRPTRVAAAGRTDAGVHAHGQVIAFEAPAGTDLHRLRLSVNALTDDSISVLVFTEAEAGFDPRRHASSRSYEYTILNARPPSPFLMDRAWRVHQPLDVDVLSRLAALVVGEHDFRSFRAADCESRSTRRTVLASEWTRSGDVLVYRVTANAFLKQMVRTLVGSMVDVEVGRLSEAGFARLLEGGDEAGRAAAGRTAPPMGLSLVRVDYDGPRAPGARNPRPTSTGA